jgi:hypothetical protein
VAVDSSGAAAACGVLLTNETIRVLGRQERSSEGSGREMTIQSLIRNTSRV